MKRILFLAACFCFLQSTLNAQIKVGIRGGLNLSTISGDDYIDQAKDNGFDLKNKLGYYGGLYIDIPISKSFSIQPGAFYTVKGYRFLKEKSTEKKTTRLNLDTYKRYDVIEKSYSKSEQIEEMAFIEVPLLLTYQIKISNSLRARLGAGPYAAYLLHGKQTIKTESSFSVKPDLYKENRSDKKSDSNSYELDDFKFDDRLDYGVSALAELSWKNIGVGVSYDLGIAELLESYKTRNIAFFIGFEF